MTRFLGYLVSLVSIIVFCAAGAASATTINFQELVNSGTLPIGTVVTNQFEAEGVLFSLENVVSTKYRGPIADGFGYPSTRGLFNTFNYNIPILATFSVPVRRVSFASIPGSPLTVEAFDRFGRLLATSSIAGGLEIGEVATSEDIFRLRFLNDSGTGYAGRSDLTIIRNLTFVPEPSTSLLLGFGLVGLAVSGRARSQST